MKLSGLQKFILRTVWNRQQPRVPRSLFLQFYQKRKNPPTLSKQIKIITQSLERLIDKGLIVGFGHKTKEKYFIKEVKLTAAGKKVARELLGKQAPLPIKLRKKAKY